MDQVGNGEYHEGDDDDSRQRGIGLEQPPGVVKQAKHPGQRGSREAPPVSNAEG